MSKILLAPLAIAAALALAACGGDAPDNSTAPAADAPPATTAPATPAPAAPADTMAPAAPATTTP